MSEIPCKDPLNFNITSENIDAYQRNGYVIVRGLFSAGEVEKLLRAAQSPLLRKHCQGTSDGKGLLTRKVLWNQPGNDVTGLAARCEKMVNTAEQLMGGEVYHYHSKLMLKEPMVGGAHLWHQDYGYWYENGCLYPDMATCFVALDRSTKANGCLQILEGSHKLGRIEHKRIAGQTAADLERVEQLRKRLPLMFVELEPGDAVFFHCNILHTSDQNTSHERRYAFLVAYNRATNDPVIKHHHPFYSKLDKVSNEAFSSCENYNDLTGKDFFDPFQLTAAQQLSTVLLPQVH